MATICPTITATSLGQYRQQMERIEPFARHVHIDCMDGQMTPTTSPPLSEVWWPKSMKADLHLMYKNPTRHMRAIVKLKPRMVIVQAEAEGDFITFAQILRKLKIKVGVSLLPQTPASAIVPALEYIDHVMIFSGDLGKFGGVANLNLLIKAQALKHKKKSLEFGWDGGINQHNVTLLAAGGIDLLNVGGGIHKAADPAAAYATMKALLRK